MLLLITGNLVTPPGSTVSPLFSLAHRSPQTNLSVCTLRKTQGCRFQVSCHYFANQDFNPTWNVSLFPPSRGIHNCQWIKLKENKFSCGRIPNGLFSWSLFPRCIPVERTNRAPDARFSRLPASCSITIFTKISRAVLWRCLQLHLSYVLSSLLTSFFL